MISMDVPPIIRAVPPPVPRKKGMPLAAKLVLAGVFLFAAFLSFRIVQFALHVRAHPRQEKPGEAAFREANRLIIANRGTTAFGNSSQARALASDFSTRVQVLREEFFTKSEGDKTIFATLAKGEFLTFCHLDDDSCVFLVHVPELRRFSPEAKESLGDIAWMTAQGLLQERVERAPRKLAVGVKGELWYDPILIGDFTADPESPTAGIRTRTSGIQEMELFYPFFATEAGLLEPAEVPTR